MLRFLLVYMLCFAVFLKAEPLNIDSLLESYRLKSDLSNITKSESAGFVDVFTRDDIERMQAKTLADITKLFTVPFISRTNLNSTLFIKPAQQMMPTSAIRIFVNDHDITATSYQSGAMICGSITLDAIDHIEVYRSSASVEFGNEPSSMVIKLYTKKASREEGGKLRVTMDGLGSSYASAYFGETLSGNRDYFVFGNINQIQRDTYYNQNYGLSSDSDNANFYVNFNFEDLLFEIGHFQSKIDPFLGMGRSATPNSTESEAKYTYVHLTKKLENGIRLQASLDYVSSDGQMSDNSGIYAGDFGFVQDFSLDSLDKVYSFTADKTFKKDNNSLFVGGFIKHKQSDINGQFDTNILDFSTYYNLYSIYAENKYTYNKKTMIIVSLKGDFYRYEKDVEDKNEYIFRFGAIRNVDNFQVKMFYTRTYYAAPLISLYSDDTNAPYKTNASLDFIQPTLYSFGIRYKTDKHTLNFRTSYIELNDPIKYSLTDGFYNAKDTSYMQYEASYTYRFSLKNRITFDAYYGNRKDNLEFSPAYGAHLIAYNTYRKFDLFNMLEYRASYENFGVEVSSSYDWTSSILYNYTKDLKIGIKGENILAKGYEQVYKGLDYSIPVFDRKFWLNVEYLF